MASTLLTLDQAAERLGRSVETLRYWRKRGEGPPAFRLGRRVVVAEDDLTAWIDAHRAGATLSEAPVR